MEFFEEERERDKARTIQDYEEVDLRVSSEIAMEILTMSLIYCTQKAGFLRDSEDLEALFSNVDGFIFQKNS